MGNAVRLYYFDDSGDRGRNKDDSPWLVIGGFGIDAEEVPQLAEGVRQTARRFGLGLEHPAELKFQHVGKSKHGKHRNWMLDAGIDSPHKKRALVFQCLRGGLSLPSVRVVSVAVDRRELGEGEVAIVAAVRNLLDRVQMDCQDFGTHGLVMMDEEHADDTQLRAALRQGSDLIKKYARVHDTIAFLPSEESPGIQLADLVAGGLGRYLNRGDPGFARIIWPRMRHRNGNRVGYGLKGYPGWPQIYTPRAQTVPWPEFDRKVHEHECEVHGMTVTWSEAGTPDAHFELPSVPGIQ